LRRAGADRLKKPKLGFNRNSVSGAPIVLSHKKMRNKRMPNHGHIGYVSCSSCLRHTGASGF